LAKDQSLDHKIWLWRPSQSSGFTFGSKVITHLRVLPQMNWTLVGFNYRTFSSARKK
jgi:hypothetical protein